MSLVMDGRVDAKSFSLQVSLELSPEKTVALVGPNGAGKSTLLRAIAGLQPLDEGRIALDGSVLDEPDTRTFVPPHLRSVGMVFQDYALFNHMSVEDNVGFALRAKGMARRESRRIAGEWLDRFNLSGLRGRLPRELSGGERQRVSLARALTADPRVLLLDEALAAADVTSRVETRRMLRDHLQGFSGMRVLVTHDPVEAFAMAARIVVLEAGRITHDSDFASLVAHPRTPYAAALVGLNVVEGVADGSATITTAGGVSVSGANPVAPGPALAVIAPTAVALHRSQPSGSPRNVWETTVADIDDHGGTVRVAVSGSIHLIAEITRESAAQLSVRRGDRVWISVKALEVRLEPR